MPVWELLEVHDGEVRKVYRCSFPEFSLSGIHLDLQGDVQAVGLFRALPDVVVTTVRASYFLIAFHCQFLGEKPVGAGI